MLTSTQVVLEYYRRMNTIDFAFAAEMLSEDFTLDWPQSNERIRGRKNFTTVNTEYPAAGPWRFTINHLVASENEVVTDVSVTDGALIARAITFHTIRDGLIIKQVEFWPDSYPPPENRRHLVEPME